MSNSYFFLRNVVSNGRIGYAADRSGYTLRANGTGSHRLKIEGYQDANHWWISAADTARPGSPGITDNIMSWAYAPLRLCLCTDWQVLLSGVGDGFPGSGTGTWIPERYTGVADPRPGGQGKTIDFVRLSLEGIPGHYLSLNAEANPLVEVADSSLQLVVRDHPCTVAGGWPSGAEAWWVVEPADAKSARTPEFVEMA